MLNIFKSKNFDFCDYLINGLDYAVKEDYPNLKIFECSGIEVTVYKVEEYKGYNVVSIDFQSINFATFRFIPKSKTMVDIMFKQIEREVLDLWEQKLKNKKQNNDANAN